MNIDTAFEIWEALHPHIAGGFQEAADDFVTVLIENSVEAKEIAEYATDSHIKKTLQDYLGSDLDDEDVIEDWEEEMYE